jgi:hypothetical protein
MTALWNNFFIFIVLTDTIILPLDYLLMMYRLLCININFLTVIEWTRTIFDDNKLGGLKYN